MNLSFILPEPGRTVICSNTHGEDGKMALIKPKHLIMYVQLSIITNMENTERRYCLCIEM